MGPEIRDLSSLDLLTLPLVEAFDLVFLLFVGLTKGKGKNDARMDRLEGTYLKAVFCLLLSYTLFLLHFRLQIPILSYIPTKRSFISTQVNE